MSEITRFPNEVVAAIYREAPTADPRQRHEPAKTSIQPSLSRIQRYTELMAGRWQSLHASQSEADLELCCYLAEAHRGDVNAIERDFCASKLHRTPPEKHQAYPRMTAEKAVEEWRKKPSSAKVEIDPEAWRPLFPTYQQFVEATLAGWVVDRWARRGDITMIGGLPKDGKTWVMLAIVRAMLTGEKLFGYFNVEPSERVIYLIPEAGIAAIKRRLEKMGLMKFIKDGRLFVMPRSIAMVRKLEDPRIRTAAKDADLFLDTAIRFIEGDENKSVDVKIFSENCLDLATVARTVWAAHHAPKSFADAKSMSLENMLRGSGDLAAMISNAFGIAKINRETTEIRVESLGQRDDDEYLAPFHLEGRPHIDTTGTFKLITAPGQAGEYSDHKKTSKGKGREASDKSAKCNYLLKLQEEGVTKHQELADRLNEKFSSNHDKSTITRWISESKKKEAAHETQPLF